MKYYFILVALALVMWGCSSSVDTANLSAEDRFKYAMNLYNDEDYAEALKEYQNIVLQYPGSGVVDDAQYYLGMAHYERGEYLLGAYEFSKLIKNMTASEFVPQAQYMLGESYYKLSPNYTLDQRYTKTAIKELQSFIDFFPTNEKVPDAEVKIAELNDKLAHKEYNTAYIYGRLEYYKAAIEYYTNVEEMYHDTKYAPMAMYDKILLLVERKDNSAALAEIDKLLQRYPDNEHKTELQAIKTRLESNG